MDLTLQDIDRHRPKVMKHFKKYPSASISAMFRHLRKSTRLSFFGDYLLIAFIVDVLQEMNVLIRRPQLLRTIRQSADLKGRKVVVAALLNNEMAIRKKTQSVHKQSFFEKGIPTSITKKIAYV